MKNYTIIIVITVAFIFGSSGFFAGKNYQNYKKSLPTAQQFGYSRFSNRKDHSLNERVRPRQFVGEIISKDDKSLTVKTQDGGSKIVFIADTTIISRSNPATQTDLKTGTTIAVFGPENDDGSVTASNVQLNPRLRSAPPEQ